MLFVAALQKVGSKHPLLNSHRHHILYTLTSTSNFSSLVDSFSNIDEDDVEKANFEHKDILSISRIAPNKDETGGSTDRGVWGVYANRPIKPNETVIRSRSLPLPPNMESQRSSHSLQIGWNKHIMMDLPARLINHCCDANLGLQENSFGAYDFIALRNIAKHEELTIDYETAEYEIGSFEECFCGSVHCRGFLGGFKVHEEEVKERYGKYIAAYLK